MTEFNQQERTSAPGRTVAAGLLCEAESWTKAQCELLSGVEAMWTQWMKRQRESADRSLRSLRQIYECRTFADLVQVQQQWFADATRQGAVDFGNLASDAVALSWRAIGADAAARGVSLAARERSSAKPGGDAPPQRAAAE